MKVHGVCGKEVNRRRSLSRLISGPFAWMWKNLQHLSPGTKINPA